MKAKVYTLLFSSLLCVSALADNEPWQNPQINEINREPMYAHFIPFTNEANALKQRSLPADVRFDVNPATERRFSLMEPGNSCFQRITIFVQRISINPDTIPGSGAKYKSPEVGNCKDSMLLSIRIPAIHFLPILRMYLPITIR